MGESEDAADSGGSAGHSAGAADPAAGAADPAADYVGGGATLAGLLAEIRAATASASASASLVTTALASLPAVVTAAIIAAHEKQLAAKSRADRQARFAAATSRIQGATVKEIAEKNNLTLGEMGAQLACVPCVRNGNHTLKAAGLFQCLDRPLPIVRQVLARHFDSAGHKRCVAIVAQEEAQRKLQHKTAEAIGRAAYNVFKEGCSYYSFERNLLLLDLSGVNIGTLNHSREFISSFLDPLHDACMARTRNFLDRPSEVLGGRKRGIAFNADKSTELRRTGQLLGAIMLLEGELTAMLLEDSIVMPSQSDAAGLAKKIFDGMLKASLICMYPYIFYLDV